MPRAQVLGAAAVVALVGCATPKGPWVVTGTDDDSFKAGVQVIVDAAKRVTPDEKGWLAMGGEIRVQTPPDWINCNPWTPPEKTSGCSGPGIVQILIYPPFLGPHPLQTALPHELCHLGLERGSGFFGGPVVIPSEREADDCARAVILEADKGFFR